MINIVLEGFFIAQQRKLTEYIDYVANDHDSYSELEATSVLPPFRGVGGMHLQNSNSRQDRRVQPLLQL